MQKENLKNNGAKERRKKINIQTAHRIKVDRENFKKATAIRELKK